MPTYAERFHMSLRDSLVRLRNLLCELEPHMQDGKGRHNGAGPEWAAATDLRDVMKQLDRTDEAPSSIAVTNLIHRLNAYLKLPGEK